jgi:hypothetical protein
MIEAPHLEQRQLPIRGNLEQSGAIRSGSVFWASALSGVDYEVRTDAEMFTYFIVDYYY